MSGPDAPDAPPPEVPEEFAAAYRDAYRRALEDSDLPPTSADQDPGAPAVPAPEVFDVGADRTEQAASRTAVLLEQWRGTSWFVPVVVAALAVLVVAAAYAIGRALSSDGPVPRATVPPAASGVHPTAPTDEPTAAVASIAPGAWRGPVAPVGIGALSANCVAPPGQDSAGHKVTYVPANAIDGRARTAWRCDGTAIGQTLTLRLASPVDVAEVGLIPGYAKTDPSSGVDRYAQNNRITEVRWTLADGVSVVQHLDPDPLDRRVQLLRVPRTTTDRITLEILEVRRGPMVTTAISELVVSAAN